MSITLSPQQQERDRAGLKRFCAACGHVCDWANRLVIAADGFRVHSSHFHDPHSGYYGEPYTEEP